MWPDLVESATTELDTPKLVDDNNGTFDAILAVEALFESVFDAIVLLHRLETPCTTSFALDRAAALSPFKSVVQWSDIGSVRLALSFCAIVVVVVVD